MKDIYFPLLGINSRIYEKMFQVVVTNTVPHDLQKLQCHKIKTVDISILLAEAIRRIHNKESMSHLFRHVTLEDWRKTGFYRIKRIYEKREYKVHGILSRLRELFSEKFRWKVYEWGPLKIQFLVRRINQSCENRDFICISDFDKVLKWTTTSCLWFIGGRYHFCRATYFYPWAT